MVIIVVAVIAVIVAVAVVLKLTSTKKYDAAIFSDAPFVRRQTVIVVVVVAAVIAVVVAVVVDVVVAVVVAVVVGVVIAAAVGGLDQVAYGQKIQLRTKNKSPGFSLFRVGRDAALKVGRGW